MKIIKFITRVLVRVVYKIMWYLHKLFPKKSPVLTCGGCLNNDCKYSATTENLYCYYHTKKNRKVNLNEIRSRNVCKNKIFR